MKNTGGDLKGHLRGVLHDLYMSVGSETLLINSPAGWFVPLFMCSLQDICMSCVQSPVIGFT